MIRHAQGNPSQPDVKFYKSMAQELFFNVRKLYSQIEAHYEAGVEVGRVGSQMAVSRVNEHLMVIFLLNLHRALLSTVVDC